MSKEQYLSKAIEWVEGRPIEKMCANYEGYEKPQSFINQATDEEVTPDISFVSKQGIKNYTEIALKSDQKTQLVTRWKLLSTMANLKKGRLFLIAPKGHKMFTQQLVNQYNINAKILSI